MSAFVYVTPVGYSAVSRTHWTVRPVMVVVAAMRSTMTWWLIKGLPLQFIVICENSLCSILFHLLVPGGKWQTEISSPVSSANFCNSVFHNRNLYPLLPPQSAVIMSFFASGYDLHSIIFHHLRILSTAKEAVS